MWLWGSAAEGVRHFKVRGICIDSCRDSTGGPKEKGPKKNTEGVRSYSLKFCRHGRDRKTPCRLAEA